MHIISCKPPNPEVEPEEGPEEGPAEAEVEQSRILARITVFMAGAIFGTVLLYLCLSRHGFSTLGIPNLNSNDRQGWALDQIITRNYVVLAMYIGFTSPTGFGSWKSTDVLLPEGRPTERTQDYTAVTQSSHESHYTIIDSPR
ncbi:hypothetical protein TGAMA5MH_01256 [Trichoderma gamsii]|uniref:Uncharacterized protein n=1 Tax=Trichoderma gamsii TaxID=398673 RepID=A0A2K0TPH8_9HYPO|nr:hypothetical protein TGAMA5MH_01256 [Trichoderma gamsii]